MPPTTPTTATIHIAAPRAAVWSVLADPSTYPDWLVGAHHIRRIDPTWPATGSRFHHSIGFGPLRVRDATSVIHHRHGDRLDLRAGMGPLGAATVSFRLADDTDGDGTELTLEESLERGIAEVVGRVAPPLVHGLLWGRNRLSLHELKAVIERDAD